MAKKRAKETSFKRIAIVGAGIVGVSTAIWLQRGGHEVVVIDREGPAAGTSYGNAGVLAAASVVPVSVPGLWKKAPGMLFSADAPLFMRWSYLPRLVPWLTQFLSNGKDARVQKIADALSLLLHDCADQHSALAEGTGAEKYLTHGDYVFGYRDRTAYEADAYGWAMREARGHPFEEMTAEEFAAYDPAMAGRFGFGVRCPNHGRISDPGAYVRALAAHAEGQGVEFVKADVLDVIHVEGSARGVATAAGTIAADEVVVATGAWSKTLTEKFGSKIPLEAERGYHIEFVNPSIMPKSPVMVATGKYVMTPMDGRLRCAGIVEFGGLTEERSRGPLELLKRQTMELLPELKYDRIDEWLGYRPSTTDSLPMIGAFEKAPNVWSAFGHQHIGLSGGPKTGRWIAQMIAGQTPNADLSAFAPNRFQ